MSSKAPAPPSNLASELKPAGEAAAKVKASIPLLDPLNVATDTSKALLRL